MKTLAILVLSFTVVGCVSNKPEPLPRVVRIEVPTILPCPAVAPDAMAYATSKLKKHDTDFDKIKALLVERQERAGVEYELRALLDVCTHR